MHPYIKQNTSENKETRVEENKVSTESQRVKKYSKTDGDTEEHRSQIWCALKHRNE